MPKILFLLEDYNHFYTQEGSALLNKAFTYQQTLDKLIAKKYYQSNSMANAFKELGYETEIIVPEANPLQVKWLKENNLALLLQWKLQAPARSYRSRVLKQYRTSYNTIQFKVLNEQVKKINPDIIYVYSNIYLTESQVIELKTKCKKIVLQWTTPLWREHPEFPYHAFDLIVTAAKQLESYFKNKNYKTVYLQQAFDESILEQTEAKTETPGELVFIGGFSIGHQYRFEVLEHLLKNKIKIDTFGTGSEMLPKDSLLYQQMQGPLFGIEMYNKYRRYKMAIHIHTTGKEDDGMDWNRYAGAKRLFEITGSGTLLFTSHQENIKDLFEIDKEVVTFTTPNDLLLKIKTLLNDPEKIKAIAKRGQERTLRDHSFKKRAAELNPYLLN